ncbi:MAG: hypothetical protein JXK07_12405 [Spirochaetes bacterium]|nr:hypothetical protein [Spirochaetota bacterium]MBN2771554.1 hypothetical protein [Spirochaetota bacterium]
MKFNIKAFTISSVIVCTLPAFILFTWCAINNFAIETVVLFETIHPSGAFSLTNTISSSFTAKIPGIIFNTLYVAVDTFIFTFLFALLYNLLSGNNRKAR